jgi:flagellar biosynthesis chaperone FliJ
MWDPFTEGDVSDNKPIPIEREIMDLKETIWKLHLQFNALREEVNTLRKVHDANNTAYQSLIMIMEKHSKSIIHRLFGN